MSRMFSKATLLCKNKNFTSQELDEFEKQGAELREEIFLLNSGLERVKPVYEIVGRKKIVAEIPKGASNVVKLSREMISSRLYDRKQELFVLYMLGRATYVENYEKDRLEEETQLEAKKLQAIQENVINLLKPVRSLSEALETISPYLNKLESATRIKILSRLQEIVYYEGRNLVLDPTSELACGAIPKLTRRGHISRLKNNNLDLVTFLRSINKNHLTQPEIMRFLHAQSMLYLIEETEVNYTLERKVLTDEYSPSVDEFSLLLDIIAWSEMNKGVLKEAYSIDYLFNLFRNVVLNTHLERASLDALLKVCIRLSPQIGRTSEHDEFRKALAQKLSDILNVDEVSTSMRILLWLHVMEKLTEQENLKFTPEMESIKSFIQPATEVLAANITTQYFENIQLVLKYFEPVELKALKERAKQLVNGSELNLQEFLLCSQVCDCEVLPKQMKIIRDKLMSCEAEVFTQVLGYFSEDARLFSHFKEVLHQRLLKFAQFVVKSDLGLQGLHKYLSAMTSRKDCPESDWIDKTLPGLLHFYEQTISELPMPTSQQNTLLKLLILIGSSTDLQIKNKVKVKHLAQGLLATDSATIQTELFLQMYKMFSKKGEAQDRTFIKWITKSCLGMILNESKQGSGSSSNTKIEPEYLKLLLSVDRFAVNHFLEYFYSQLPHRPIDEEFGSGNRDVMKVLAHKLVTVLDHLQDDIESDLFAELLHLVPYGPLGKEDQLLYRGMLEKLVQQKFRQLEVKSEDLDAEGFADQYSKALHLLSRSAHVGCKTQGLLKLVLSDDHLMMVFHLAAGM